MLGNLSGSHAVSKLVALFFAAAPMAQEQLPTAATEVLDQTAKSLSIAVWVVVIIVGVLAIIFFSLKIRNELAKGKPAVSEDSASTAIDSALKSERKGDFVKAAMNYETLGDFKKAAAMYEKGREFTKAAALYEKLGKSDKAVVMYKRAGESLKAAGVYMRAKNFAEAAKIFKNKGDNLRAAQAFEMMGNTVAAAREYAASGQYMRAARMYKDERMYREAGEVYARAIGNEPVTVSNMGKYYTYAAFLVMSEDLEGAEKVYRSIAAVDASFRDVQEKIRLIGLRAGEAPEPELAIDHLGDAKEKKEQPAPAAAPAEAPPVKQPPVAPAAPAEKREVKAKEPAVSSSYEEAIEGLFAPRERPSAPKVASPEAPVEAPKAAKEEVPPVVMEKAPAAAQPKETPPAAPPTAPPTAPIEAPKEAVKEAQIEAPVAASSVEAPPEETVDLTVPSKRMESAPSLDTSALEIIEKVMGQSDIDDLFEQEGGGEIEEEVSDEEGLSREATLRSILKSGRMDPHYSMRMWMQILKQLYEKHSAGVYYGSIPPESIHIDMENNVRLEDPGRQQKEYTAPEVLSGAPADEQTDIYAMGAILYEMVTGTVETIGEIYPIDAYDDIPEWMDEMIMHCLEKDRSVRYSGLDEISSLVLQRVANA